MKAGTLLNRIKYLISWLAWPVLLSACLAATAYGFSIGRPVITFNSAYFSLAAVLLLLERMMPHERAWLPSDGQLFPDLAHTLVSKGTVQTLIVFSSAIGLAAYATPMAEPGFGLWPRVWPLWMQIVLAMAVSEFGLYWAHRIAHEWTPLWRFHAIHHSVVKLWVVNTGRFHFVDSLKSILPGMAILIPLDAPMEALTWMSIVTAYIGLLTHCNVEMRFGFLSAVFNTPGLHRWHHSRDISEGNKNYGENLVLWDLAFGTWFNPSDRRPPVNIGISEYMPPRFADQLIWPFKRRKTVVNTVPDAAE
ncbi:MAG TPA: sterol desaturase family protein [Micavibrio sp.]|jgi:sterol desaturase/sphingolipid hydroxylase (fatty acid hydroxylase superfamily)